MEKYEKTFLVCVAIAAAGILTFWIAGFQDHDTVSAAGVFIAGVSAWIGIIAKVIGWRRYHNLYG